MKLRQRRNSKLVFIQQGIPPALLLFHIKIKSKMKYEIKTVSASTYFEIWVTCPYCDEDQDRFTDLRESLPNYSLSASGIDQEIRCKNCKKDFIVDQIDY